MPRPDFRAAERFFLALVGHLPMASVGVMHLIHWPEGLPGPWDLAPEHGFQGTLVAARASLADVAREYRTIDDIRLDDHPTAGERAGGDILMEMPQGREAERMAIEAAVAALPEGGRLWLFGNRESGIVTLGRRFEPVQNELSCGHLRLVSLPAGARRRESPGRKRRRPEVSLEEGFFHYVAEGVTLASRPGIFSWQRPDPASLLLLRALGGVEKDWNSLKMLDFGCGSGLLGVVLARRWPSLRVVMSDDQWGAVISARRSVVLNGVGDRCQVIAENGIGAVLEGERFDLIVSNPSFHRGVATDHGVVRDFIPRSHALLAPGGELWLVGSRFLDYGAPLAAHFADVRRVAQDEGFDVWCATKRRAAGNR
ncbi:MAG: methyltransferase [Magnetococcales bacterium]|nr:methyltransferase [Magnetococcales bacterium]